MANERVTICGGRFEVMAGTPLPDLNSPSAKAYAAQGTRGSTNMVALVTKPGEFARVEMTVNAAKIDSSAVVRYVDMDVAYWPDHGQQVPILLFERPAGVALLAQATDERPALNNELMFRQSVETLAEALRDLYLSGCNHGRINLTNIFLRDPASGSLQIGEYLSGAASQHQFHQYCTIEMAMADPQARGPASAAEDIYAVGVSLLHLQLGKLPGANLTREQLIALKIEKTSLMALSGGARIPSAYSELFRGLLADNTAERWALDDIAHWLGGRRTGSRPAGQLPKAQRGMELGGQSYSHVRLLAGAMTQNVDSAARQIEEGGLERWIRRTLGDETMAEKLTEAVASASAAQRGGSPAERVVTRAAITMDPPAPIRFRDLAVMPYGIGPLLAGQLVRGQSPRNLADLIAAQFIIHWANSQGSYGADQASLVQQFEGLRVLLDRPQHGFGIERVVYEIYPDCPCLSPMVAKAYPLSLKAVLIALETHAAGIPENDTRSEPMDRHLAAYILSRYRRMNDRLFPLLAPNANPGQRAVAILSIMAELQRKFHPEPMPNTAAWLVGLLTPSMERFHNRNLRERVQRDVKRLAKRGELEPIWAAIDDGNVQKQDDDGFQLAQQQWVQLEMIARELSADSEGRNRALLQQGRQITAFVAALLAACAVVATAFIRLL
jgi:eukaryotic-like serine/threonine-protein kinase